MHQIALVHGLQDEVVEATVNPGLSMRGDRRLGVQLDLWKRAHSSESAAFAAAMVCSTCSSVCASDGNQASNCEAGGETPRPKKPRANAGEGSRVAAGAPAEASGAPDRKNGVRRPWRDTIVTRSSSAARPVARRSVVAHSRTYAVSSSKPSVATPAAVASGFPDSVPAW